MLKEYKNIDPKTYNVSDVELAYIRSLSPEALGYIAAIQQRTEQVEKVKSHAETLLAEDPDKLNSLNDDDFDAIIAKFNEDYDPNLDENTQWDDAIWDYVSEDAP